ncbi:MAG: hypothetical protein JST92_06700 [Deltaproteobacteria bacterium]|nr:hypothetical protein [Deltaproteobacteria bacterium]
MEAREQLVLAYLASQAARGLDVRALGHRVVLALRDGRGDALRDEDAHQIGQGRAEHHVSLSCRAFAS